MEAVGRLKIEGSETQLSVLVLHRSVFGWAESRELRIAAMQALQRVNPNRAKLLMLRAGLEDEELLIRPLEAGENNWVRHRRYPRVVPNGHVQAIANMSKGKTPVSLQWISLGGGFACRQGRGQFGSEAMLEIQTGFRPIKGKVLIRETNSGMIFEIADMDLDERGKLRRFISAQMR